ncbi:hypothetical protein MG290_09190 [Flavobacterium sp. CBA20B-1]|uniref:hypothetical protein n=1 Tax=unclassified Flavobacterium TaxID=196869 RepID=UPI0022258628|nr:MULTISPECIES: hypothetical protein [unclassified Flavobacterium]WCM41131.1 hypothetical protein MG290_09190 [Flavobacterium sp. CBA20B-1]
MKNIIYIIFLIVSANGFAQSGIANDQLFLKYEAAYLTYLNNIDSQELKKLDEDESTFYKMFISPKAIKSFKKQKDQSKWLQKNLSKTHYKSVLEAQEAYNNIVTVRNKANDESKMFTELLEELLKKYDSKLIWKTLTERMDK